MTWAGPTARVGLQYHRSATTASQPGNTRVTLATETLGLPAPETLRGSQRARRERIVKAALRRMLSTDYEGIKVSDVAKDATVASDVPGPPPIVVEPLPLKFPNNATPPLCLMLP